MALSGLRKLCLSLTLPASVLLFMGFGPASNGRPAGDTESRIAGYFSALSQFHGEKLWLHIDKPYYGAGDSIWFRGYLTDAMTHRADTLSNYIYVELTDRRNQIVLSRKIRRDSCGFANCLPLPAKLPAGDYTLRAYTSWMMNFDAAFFFQRNLQIGNSIADQVNSSVAYIDRENEPRQVVVRFYDANKTPYAGADVKYRVYDSRGRDLGQMHGQTTASGAVFVDLPADSLAAGGYAEMVFEKLPLYYTRNIFFPDRSERFTVGFFPEGGDLIAGSGQTVAFKAECADGRIAELSGAVVGRAGDTVARFATEHSGMGAFFLPVREGETYRALVRDQAGQVHSFALPEVKRDGYSLSAVAAEGCIRYRIDRAGAASDSLWLVAHTRGRAALIVPATESRLSGHIPTDSLDEGILHLLLVDGAGHPRSERLVFVRHPERAERWSVATAKPSGYGRREQVVLQMEVSDSHGRPLQGDFSVSVTDRRTVTQDSLADHIVSNLLLTSNIKGHFDSPGWYFAADDRQRRRGLDLLMLTHGWRRFALDSLLQAPRQQATYFIEHGQYLSGHVIGMMDRPAAGAKVTAVDSRQGIFVQTETDAKGNFVMEGLDYKDSTTLLVSALTRKGKPVQEVVVEKDYLRPPFVRRAPFPDTTDGQARKAMEAYLQNAKDKYYTDGGMKVYSLKEFTVTGVDPRRPKASMYSEFRDTTSMAPFRPMSLIVYVQTLPAVVKMGGEMMIRRKGAPITIPLSMQYTCLPIVINGQKASCDDLGKFTVNDVLYINLTRRIEDLTISGLPPYYLEIVLKEEYTFNPDVTVIKTMGYAESVRFYAPAYDTQQQHDNGRLDRRTTIYWNPCVKTDSTGRVSVSFYTDDSDAPQYDVTIEGIGPDGRPYRYSGKM